MTDPSQPTKTCIGDATGGSSFPSIEEGRFPAGTTLAGRFRILGLLGKGGMGEVYRALDLTLNQPVALKFIHHDSRRDEAALARFRNEVRIARQVSHPNVCRVYDIGVIEGQHFLSMEYVDGEDLASLLRRIGRLPSDKALEFTRRICAGLAAAHERGVLHRDLKPANIMIDGRGQVRITDFGLAALAGDVVGREIRSGTPAYMSPEQKAAKEVTTRSDLYALGIVLHEMFTGKRPGDSQSTPTTIVKDLDPTIERVILRCLENDPRNRPSSALHVAMSLPGGDPIAAALAAGETPSPEMVAASGEKEGLHPRTAIACFAGVAVLLAALLFICGKSTLVGRAPLPLAPDVLAFKARELLTQFGYTETPVDVVYGFFPAPAVDGYQRYLRSKDLEHVSERLASHQPVLTSFMYRQHQAYFQPGGFLSVPGVSLNAMVTPQDPPTTQQGMLGIHLSPVGTLEALWALPSARLSRVPGPLPPSATPGGWNSLLLAAGLDPARFTMATPEEFVPVHADSRMAWTGTYEDGRPDTIRVEAAALNGRPVHFRIFGPWDQPEVAATPAGVLIANLVLASLLLVALGAGAFIAWRNIRLGRGDVKGAWRLAGLFFGGSFIVWALAASHEPTLFEIFLLVNGLALACLYSGAVAILYVAVEPYARRHWPDALISWMRMIGGRCRDPLVASHILIGITVGLAGALARQATVWASDGVTTLPGVPLSLSSARQFASLIVSLVQVDVYFSIVAILVLVLLRGAVRRTWMADTLFVVLLSLGSLGAPATVPATVLMFTAMVVVLRRCGLLALAALIIGSDVPVNLPFAVTSWYSAYSLTSAGLILAVAGWAMAVVRRASL